MNKQMSVSMRLGLGFFVILALMVAVAVVSALKVDVIDRSMSQISSQAGLKQRYAINFRGSVHDRAIAVRDAVSAADPAFGREQVAEIERLAQLYADSAAPMKAMLAQPSADTVEKQLMQQIETIEAKTNALTQQVVELRFSEDSARAHEFLLDNVAGAYTEWLRLINAFIDHQEASINQDVAVVRETASGFLALIVAVTGVAVLLGVAIAVVIIRKLRSILGAEPDEVARVIGNLANGDLGQVIVTPYPDSVMGATAKMASRLTAIIAEVRAAADGVGVASGELRTSSANSNQQIQHQSAEAEQVATAINQMATTVNEVASFAARAAAAAKSGSRPVRESSAKQPSPSITWPKCWKARPKPSTRSRRKAAISKRSCRSSPRSPSRPTCSRSMRRSRRRVPASMVAASQWWPTRCARWPTARSCRPAKSAR